MRTHGATHKTYYRKYIDAFGSVITNIKVIGDTNIRHNHWLFSLIRSLSHVTRMIVTNPGHDIHLTELLSITARTFQHLHLTDFIMSHGDWHFVRLPCLKNLIIDKIHNINPNRLQIFFDMNPTIVSVKLMRILINDGCLSSLENVKELVLFEMVNVVALKFLPLASLQQLRQLSITTYDSMTADQWDGLIAVMQLTHLKIKEQNAGPKTIVSRNQTLNRLFKLLSTLNQLNLLTFDGEYNINSTVNRLVDRYIETGSIAKFHLNMNIKNFHLPRRISD